MTASDIERFHTLQGILYERSLDEISDPFQRAAIIEQAGFEYPFETRAVDEIYRKRGSRGVKPLVEFMRDEVSEEYRRKIGTSALAKIDKPLKYK